MSGTDSVRTSLAAMAALLAPAHPDVAQRVLRAHDDPEGYVRAYADELADRGIDEPIPDLAWIALCDALAGHRLLAEFDWKEDPHEIRAQLGHLASRPSVDPWVLLEDGDTELPTFEFLEVCGRHHQAIGAALAVLDIESDCYPVVCLRAAHAKELTSLATSAGFRAWTLGDGVS
ncbi:DUF6630 family protein [Streptomyces sp. NPDC058001]|uniref:DUF6630 family protein n=1 Tax=Streptomyces sp. NPDC058001 TaxID=3346300 RepID=UPI0036EB6E45